MVPAFFVYTAYSRQNFVLLFKFRKLLTLRRGRSCAGPQDRPLRSADLAGFVTAQDQSLLAAEHGIAIFKMELMYGHLSWLEVETT